MIKEDYVSFEVAKLLKEKGFDEPCRTYYQDEKFVDDVCTKYYQWNSKSPFGHISAPTHQMAMKWLREVHNIFIEISTSIDLNGKYHFSYTILDKECKYVRRGYTDFDWNYEEAAEAALKYSLEILI